MVATHLFFGRGLQGKHGPILVSGTNSMTRGMQMSAPTAATILGNKYGYLGRRIQARAQGKE